jgi:hypothetical protein
MTGKVFDEVRSSLLRLNSSTEHSFLLVGERLTEVRSTALEIEAQTLSIAALLSDDQHGRSMAVLETVLERAREMCEEEHAVAERVREVSKNANAIVEATRCIEGIVRAFDVLGIMTRIESARLSGSSHNFVGLAGEVTALAARIREQLLLSAESARLLAESTSRAASEVGVIARTQQENLAPLSSRVGAGLDKTARCRSRSSESARLLAARFAAVSNAVGDIVAALQAHDITRQQLEHVVEALDTRQSAPAEHNRLANGARLQAAQIENARSIFARSVSSVCEALAEIEANVVAMADETAGLLDLSHKDGASDFLSVESDLAGIVAILDGRTARDAELSDVARTVRAMLAEIATRMGDVQAIGIHMKRIAVNATIQAARLGTLNGPLEVIAEAIQALAVEAGTTCEQISRRIEEMSQIGANLVRAGDGRDDSATHIGEVRRIADHLHAIQESTMTHHGEAVQMAARLTQQIRETIAAFGTHDHISDVLTRGAEDLRALASVGETVATDLQASAGLYTMRSERAVHESVLSGGEQPPMLASAAAASRDNQLPVLAAADNVEFF